ncbi:MAG: hypothetical protein IPN34_22500 [Planctomycetes bacterium]|nr:hypothetical protein [Planctomycetota bacterium]
MVALRSLSAQTLSLSSLSVLLAAFCATTTSAQSPAAGAPPDAAQLAPLVKQLEKSFAGTKKHEAGEAFLSDLETRAADAALAADDAPELYRKELAALRTFAAQAHVPAERKPSEWKLVRKKVAKVAPPTETWPEVEFLAYAFGTRELAAQSELATKPATALAAGKLALTPQILPLGLRAADLARGTFPERELILAGLLRSLDVDRGPERYARFLDSWRNPGPDGEETFYQALDRTSGTEASVFFYDIMLAEFTKGFADVEGSKSLKVAHDHLHTAFLTYRQYRGFCEAVAHALLLPHDEPLPHRLRRYDYSSTKGLPAGRDYSLRHQIDILLEDAHGDPLAIVQLAQEILRGHPLPDPLWSAESDPVFYFGQRFAEKKLRATTEELKAARWKRSEARARAWRLVVMEGLAAAKA